jgi:thioesterase domain-containing protein
VKPMATSAMVETLTPIWQRVLQVSSIGADDNFFDLGGDSALALQLFHEIALTCGRELPPVMIYHAPTIAALAALLDQPIAPPVPALVQLRSGSEQPPIFIAHGLGGSVIDFYQVVKYIDSNRTIYGVQAKGIDSIEEPLDRIEDMARYSLDAIKQIQPHGPYLLIGFSLGGLVMLEMAQQLIANREEVKLLAMLDSYPHISRVSRSERMRVWGKQTWRRLARRLQWLGLKPPYQTTLDVSPAPSLQHFRDTSYLALQRYQPRFYPGKISFVRAEIPTDFPANPAAVWSNLAREFDVKTVPGDHLGIMTEQYENLGAAISACLRESISR